MQIIDANILLRYLLSDHDELSPKAEEIIDNNNIHLPIEVLCEVVYVLEKVYKVDRTEISMELTDIINDLAMTVPSKDAVLTGLNIYGTDKHDLVDCILVGYYEIENAKIHTFDDKLKKIINRRSIELAKDD